MDQQFGQGKWACVPSFPHVQPCGKIRRIDDAKKGGQNGATRMSEKIHLPSALHPGISAKLIYDSLCKEDVDPNSRYFHIHTGTEDLPDAYRSMPCSKEDLAANCVAVRNPDTHKCSSCSATPLSLIHI